MEKMNIQHSTLNIELPEKSKAQIKQRGKRRTSNTQHRTFNIQTNQKLKR